VMRERPGWRGRVSTAASAGAARTAAAAGAAASRVARWGAAVVDRIKEIRP
jgi:hypothetical protein